MALIIGLTGGIGSGKTAASDYFASLGITVVDADQVAREVVMPGSRALAAITEHFGQEVIQSSGELDRAYLRKKIFSDPQAKQWLEALLHPLIRKSIEQQLTDISSPYGILVSPLLFETKQHQLTDRTLVIDCDETNQLQRVEQRDGNTSEQIKAIINTQLSREERNQKADDVISNNGLLTELHTALNQYHQSLLTELAKSTHTHQ